VIAAWHVTWACFMPVSLISISSLRNSIEPNLWGTWPNAIHGDEENFLDILGIALELSTNSQQKKGYVEFSYSRTPGQTPNDPERSHDLPNHFTCETLKTSRSSEEWRLFQHLPTTCEHFWFDLLSKSKKLPECP
jgi:hypothetical protein